jgi:hypothetical protein
MAVRGVYPPVFATTILHSPSDVVTLGSGDLGSAVVKGRDSAGADIVSKPLAAPASRCYRPARAMRLFSVG